MIALASELVSSALSIAAPLAPAAAATPAAVGPAATSSFEEVLKSLAGEGVDTLRSAETISAAGVSGLASAQSVVDSVMAAERALQTIIAVRDKAVSAYQDIARMSI